MDTSNEKTHSLIRFVGFGGIVALLAAAVTVGRTAELVEENTVASKDVQAQMREVITEVRVEQQEIADVDRRVTRLEDRK